MIGEPLYKAAQACAHDEIELVIRQLTRVRRTCAIGLSAIELAAIETVEGTLATVIESIEEDQQS